MKTIGTCAECAKWEKRNEREGFCRHEKNDRNFDHLDSANPRCARQLATRIFPGPNFGCVHWEPEPDFKPFLTDNNPEATWLLQQLATALRK